MLEIETTLRKWGKSRGAVFPKKDLEAENFKNGEKIKILVVKKSNVLKETFGTLKFKKSTEQLLKETDKELDIGR